MNSYSHSIRYLYSLQKQGMKFGLRGIQTLLNSTGNPERTFPSIHIAGTNGKGSTAALIAAILTAAGYKTGLYTSPHVLDFTERIRINGEPIRKSDVVTILRTLKPFVQRNRITFFETTTALAFHYFAQRKIDIAVVETGLGGRLDATNVLQPLVSVITTIGLEHTEILGNSIPKIAYEKAGILKPHVPCITGVLISSALKVVKQAARRRASSLFHARMKLRIRSADIKGTTFDVFSERAVLKNITVSLSGAHQIRNTKLALHVAKFLEKKHGFRISSSAIRKGLADVQKYSGIQSRLSVVQKKPLIITDVAHNPDAIEALVHSLQELGIERVVLVFGVSRDKDFPQMAKLLKPIVDRAIVVLATTERARPVQDLVRAFTQLRIPAEPESSVKIGIQRAVQLAGDKPILITGSHFVVGEALAFLQRKKYLTISQ